MGGGNPYSFRDPYTGEVSSGTTAQFGHNPQANQWEQTSPMTQPGTAPLSPFIQAMLQNETAIGRP